MELVNFFIPLPEALGLVHGSTFTFEEDGSREPGSAMTITDEIPIPSSFSPNSNFVSLRLWQVNSTWSDLTERFDATFKVLSSATPFTRNEDLGENLPPLPMGTISVFEAATVIDGDTTSIDTAFDRCLDRIREVVTAVGLASGQVLPPISKERILLFVPLCRRNVMEDEWTKPSLHVLHHNDVVRYVPVDLDPEQVGKVGRYLWASVNSIPTYAFLELRAESSSAFNRSGDTRASIMTLATACEVLFELLFISIEWEISTPTKDVARKLADYQSISARVKRLFTTRLGGNWSLVQAGPIRDWFELIAEMRNRTAHTGHRPSYEDVFAAQKAADGLVSFIQTLLSNPRNAKQFPRTRFILFGDKGPSLIPEDFMHDWNTWRSDLDLKRRSLGSTS